GPDPSPGRDAACPGSPGRWGLRTLGPGAPRHRCCPSLGLLVVDDLGVNHVVGGRALGAVGTRREAGTVTAREPSALATGEPGTGTGALSALGLRGIHRRTHLLALGREGLHLGLDVVDARAGLGLERLLQVGERA